MSLTNVQNSPAPVTEAVCAANPQMVRQRRQWGSALAVAAGALVLGAAGTGEARADNVYWSIGVHSPGVNVGVGNAPPVVVYPALRRYYQQPQVVVLPPQVVYAVPRGYRGPPGWAANGHRHGYPHGHPHWKKGGRYDRDDGYRHGDYRGDHRGDKYAWDHRSRDGHRR